MNCSGVGAVPIKHVLIRPDKSLLQSEHMSSICLNRSRWFLSKKGNGDRHVDYSFYLFHGMVYICILEKKILGSTPSFYYYYDLFKLAPLFLPTSWQKLDDGFDAQKVHVCLSLLKSKHPYIFCSDKASRGDWEPFPFLQAWFVSNEWPVTKALNSKGATLELKFHRKKKNGIVKRCKRSWAVG